MEGRGQGPERVGLLGERGGARAHRGGEERGCSRAVFFLSI